MRGSDAVPGAASGAVSALVSKVLASLREGRGALTALVTVCQTCVELLPVDGASVSVMVGRRHRQSMYASDSVVEQIEDLQFSLGEGPCYEAFETGRPVLVTDLAKDAGAAWPVFAAQAAAQFDTEQVSRRVGAIFAFPLQRGAARFGALDMYRHTPGWLSEAEVSTALLITDVATSALLAASSTGAEGQVSGEWIDGLGLDRVAVHQATGVVSAALAVPMDQALAQLRGYAFTVDLLLDQVAADIVTGRLDPEAIGQ
ncbi:GAF and ANTAR domain-containing protein [Flindersiella endophytica]